MKRNFKKLFLLLAVVITAVVCFAFSASAKTVPSSGKCGTSVSYSYSSTTKKLVISGKGAMTDYVDYKSSPFYSSDIKTIVINSGITTIGDYIFSTCRELTSITIAKGVTKIGESAFYNCTNLASVSIPNSVTTIGGSAFSCCSKLNSISIPESVVTIFDGAFGYCDSLTSVKIPKTVTVIGARPFVDCDNLISINVDNGNKKYSSDEYGVLYNKDKTAIIQYPKGNKKTSYKIPEGVISIASFAFFNCNNLNSITIADSVMTICDFAFSNCKAIKNIVFSDSVISIDDSAFANCTNLTSLKISSSVKKIGNGSFARCVNLKKITIDNGVSHIGMEAFKGCESLEKIVIPDSVTYIGERAFSDCKNIATVKIGNGVTNIGVAAFFRCSSLKNIALQSNLTAINSITFKFCSSLTTVTIPKSVTNIDTSAFEGCSMLSSVNYEGTEAQWNKINIAGYNEPLRKANFNYLCSAEEYVREHYQFVRGYCQESYNIVKNENFAYEMTSVKDTSQYNYFKLISFNFDNYYDVILTDLILQQTSEDSIENIAVEFIGKAELEVLDKLSSYIGTLINKYNDTGEFSGKIENNEIIEFLTGKLDTSKNSYKLLEKFFKSSKAKKELERYMTGLDKAGQLGDFISLGVDVLNDILDCVNYIIAINAYIDYDDEYQTVFQQVATKIGNKNSKLTSSMQSYIKAASSPAGYADEVFDACKKTTGDVAFKVFKGIYKKALLSTLASYTAGTALGTVLATKVAGCTVGGCLSSVFTGLTLGVGISQLLTGADVISDHMCVVAAAGELSYYVQQVMIDAENKFANNANRYYAEFFDNAYRFYVNCQLYAYENTCEALRVQKESVVIKFFTNRDKDYKELIKEIEDDASFRKRIKCHKTDISNVVNYLGKTAYIYTGKAIKPSIEVASALENDYLVKYKNNIEIGIASVEISASSPFFKGNKIFTFKIVPEKVKTVSATQSTSKIKLTWSASKGANIYRVYYKNGSNWKKIADVTNLNYTIKNLKAGTKYSFAVKSGKKVDGKTVWSDTYTTINTATKAVKPSSLTATQSTSSIKLTWNKVAGATGYRVYQKVAGKWKTAVSSTAVTSHTFKNLKAGAKFTFAIRPYIKTDSGVVWGEYAQFTTATKPVNPTLKVTAPSKGKLTVNWKAVTGAESYQLWYKTGNGSYKLYKTYSSAKTLNFKNLKSGTKYTFAVRAVIKTSGGNVRSGYKAVSATVK